jgi:glycosyltransferase involved in cell wall biosynthesis
MSVIYFVLPCYNEEKVLVETSAQLLQKVENLIKKGDISCKSRIVFVDDGSSDDTWRIIENLHARDHIFCGIKLSHNFGHQNALLAGLMSVREFPVPPDAVISMDADLQDDIDAIDNFIAKFKEGNEIVYGARTSREKDSFFKRNSALFFYKIMSYLGANTVYNHADYRLMSRKTLDKFSQFGEVNLFLRGIVPMLGFKNCTVEYKRNKRFAGESKYSLKKMFSLAIQGITSLSIKPIRFVSALGFTIFSIAILISLYFFSIHLAGNTVPGWASTIISIWAIGGLQLLCVGIVGEYVGKIYLETKKRPRYIVEDVLRD